MASELGNQLLARVQAEMARNIATIKRQLIEWLERPESGGVDALRESMAEISGGLSLMEQEEAVALAVAIVAGVESLDQGVNEHGVNASFADKGAEIASGLLVLADYIERLDHISDTQKQSVMQATAAVKTLLACLAKQAVHLTANLAAYAERGMSVFLGDVDCFHKFGGLFGDVRVIFFFGECNLGLCLYGKKILDGAVFRVLGVDRSGISYLAYFCKACSIGFREVCHLLN